MKRFLILIIILMLAGGVLAGHQEFQLKTADGDSVWTILADTPVYSPVFNYTPEMSLHFITWDTTGGAANDSVQFILELQTRGPDFDGSAGWVTVARDTVTGDSVQGFWKVPDTASNGSKRRLKVTGGANNCQDGASFGKFEVKGWREW